MRQAAAADDMVDSCRCNERCLVLKLGAVLRHEVGEDGQLHHACLLGWNGSGPGWGDDLGMSAFLSVSPR